MSDLASSSLCFHYLFSNYLRHRKYFSFWYFLHKIYASNIAISYNNSIWTLYPTKNHKNHQINSLFQHSRWFQAKCWPWFWLSPLLASKYLFTRGSCYFKDRFKIMCFNISGFTNIFQNRFSIIISSINSALLPSC